jgi:hypothetical protein
MTRETALPTCRCPYCEHRFDAATSIGSDAVPKPGDLTLCISCASPLVFTATLTARKPLPGEIPSDHPILDMAMQIIRQMDRTDMKNE